MENYEGAHEAADDQSKPFWMSDSTYNMLKWMAQIVLPAFATFYLTIGSLLDLPSPEKVAGVVIAVDTFLGVILGLSSRAYNNSDAKYDGSVNIVDPVEGPKTYSLELNDHPEVLDQKNQIVLKVNSS